jgi:Icc-related predicted phosphoesterase
MVMGNHEHYHHRFDKTYNDFKAILPANVVLLEKEFVEYEGVVFMGATLWTDLNRGDPMTVHVVRNMMNDYRVIQNHYADKNQYYKLTPEVTVDEHRKTLKAFKMFLEMTRDKPVVVITHMSPSFASVNEKYLNAGVSNGGYASDLSEFILDHENIRVWVHGHMHDGVDYQIGNTRVLANPRGYTPWEDDNGFVPGFYFEV